MSDTTLTFSIVSSQAPVKFIDDPSQPNWEDFLATEVQEVPDGDKENDKIKKP